MKNELAQRRCKACAPGTPALSAQQISQLLPQVSGWELRNGEIARDFKFKDYYHTISFVNAVAWIANKEDHHPDMNVGYNKCQVRYSTHSVNGLSENDFICAAKVDALIE
jgi:4a-hydroxytetrahydrobiopterin dehydratase